MNLPSEVSFVSLLQYSPRGTADLDKRSRSLRDAIKNDSFVPLQRHDAPPERVRAIRYCAQAARGLIENRHEDFPFLAKVLGPDVTLIPMPRSAPLVDELAQWPGLSICRALKAEGLARDILPILKRTHAIQKAAFAGPGQRPGPREHYESTKVVGWDGPPIFGEKKIVLVDDFVTRGASFIGMYPHVEAAFPGWQIGCFALIRTQSDVSIDNILSPVCGKITFDGARLRRIP